MYLDPKKNYPSVRVRLVDYKTKAMVDISLPSEYFTDEEIEDIKETLMQSLISANRIGNYVGCMQGKLTEELEDQPRPMGDDNPGTVLDEAEISDKEIEAALFSEEEKDGEE